MNAFPPAVSEVMVCVHYRWIMDFAAVVVSSTTRHSSTNYLPFSSIRTTGILNTAREPEYFGEVTENATLPQTLCTRRKVRRLVVVALHSHLFRGRVWGTSIKESVLATTEDFPKASRCLSVSSRSVLVNIPCATRSPIPTTFTTTTAFAPTNTSMPTKPTNQAGSWRNSVVGQKKTKKGGESRSRCVLSLSPRKEGSSSMDLKEESQQPT
ncbi:hypothetical protein Fcan01_11931 [Folsomia candida]|uniref:Uncharacterized protein n=1 Tax=Folsomia candida TaxID=158441 RepID=A0A226E638_FOLCA|nr:hypothetical protein Fcan01_11931 [Folsomia candida]